MDFLDTWDANLPEVSPLQAGQYKEGVLSTQHGHTFIHRNYYTEFDLAFIFGTRGNR